MKEQITNGITEVVGSILPDLDYTSLECAPHLSLSPEGETEAGNEPYGVSWLHHLDASELNFD